MESISESTAERVFEESGPRMVGDGIPVPDLDRLRARIGGWSEWFAGWAELATEYEARADATWEAGFPLSAGELYWQACMCWHYGQFLWFQHPEEREHGQRQKVADYRKAAPLFVPAAERVDIPFEGTRIPGYLRFPPGEERPPCVVLIGGLESTKEESYLFENLCLRRGMATFAFDGPGQGEYFAQRPLVPDFERYSSAVVDYLETRSDLDASRLGVLGRSLGGYYSVRAAALDKRFNACVAFGACYDVSIIERLEPLSRLGFRYITGIPDPAKAEARARESIDLTGVAELLEAPLYILHGALDTLVPVEHAERLARTTPKAAKTVVIEPEGDHCAHNLHSRVRPPLADWLAKQLLASGYSPHAALAHK